MLMQGYVSGHPREAWLTVDILNRQGNAVQIDAVVDTGFTEFLALPPVSIRELGLERGQDMELATAGGQIIRSPTYSAIITWHGVGRKIQVIALTDRPLIGMSLLWGSDLIVQARENGRVIVSEPEPSET